MDDEIKQARITRGRIKAAVTMLKKSVTDSMALQKSENGITRVDIIKLEGVLERSMSKLDEFRKIHYTICDLTGIEDDNEIEEFSGIFDQTIAEARFLIETFYQDQVAPTTSCPESESVQSGHSGQNSSASDKYAICQSKIKLPTITLPKFNGNTNTWLEFRDVFKSLIHNDSNLNDIQKFYYLKSALEGDARKIIQGLETSESNYKIAWSSLCDRFENCRLLVQNHLAAIHKITPILKECPRDLREMLDKVNYNLRALESLDQPTDQWDAMIIYILCSKLDFITIREWESVQTDKLPTLEQFRKFLRERANILDAIQAKNSSKFNNSEKQGKIYPPKKTFMTSRISCYYCQKEHAIYGCQEFLKLSINERIEAAKIRKLCVNCLRAGHLPKDCDRSGCRKCNKKHNSLLHLESTSEPQCQAQSFHSSYETKFILLSTAQASVKDSQGHDQVCRILLDSCSQANLITKQTAERLGIKIKRINTKLAGVNNSLSNISGECDIEVKSRVNDTIFRITCLVIPQISDAIPQVKLNMSSLDIPNNIELADPKFYIPGKVDILIGVSIFWDLIKSGRVSSNSNAPSLIETSLGWIVAGIIPGTNYSFLQTKCVFGAQSEICKDISQFWEIEDIPSNNLLSEEEHFCEDHFIRNTERNKQGRFQVAIPWKLPISMLGDSKEGAMKRFLLLERKLQSNKTMREKYSQFIDEYVNLKHMTPINNIAQENIQYFLPHHGVVNEASSTTKLRVVFDGSFQTSTGYSRNSIESVGPVVQSDLLSILLRFRTHAIVISADIEKMYRQVLVKESDRHLQNIFWRDQPSDNIKPYQLNTITYGTAASSFLATRCLLELSKEVEKTMPNVSKIIREDFYVDNLLTGVDHMNQGQVICEQVNQVLLTGCFPLRKWASNQVEVLNSITSSNKETIVTLNQSDNTKTLGLYWNSVEDNLFFTITLEKHKLVTKRVILSLISKIYDPLGLLGACIIKAKILLQDLWLEKLDWDTPVNDSIEARWNGFYNELEILSSLRIPRYVTKVPRKVVDIHGFADASEKAYGACIYLRSLDDFGVITVHLLCAKSKV